MSQKILLAMAAVASLTLSLSAMSTTAEARGGHHGGFHHGHGRPWWNQWPYHNGHLRHCRWVHGWHNHHPVTFKVCQPRWL